VDSPLSATGFDQATGDCRKHAVDSRIHVVSLARSNRTASNLIEPLAETARNNTNKEPDDMPKVDSVLDEIQVFFALTRPPLLFERIAAHEEYLRTTWHKYQKVMINGEIEGPAKQLMGVAVAVTKSNDYMIELQRRELGRSGLSDRDLLSGRPLDCRSAAWFVGSGTGRSRLRN
jgi:hypothetical protein